MNVYFDIETRTFSAEEEARKRKKARMRKAAKIGGAAAGVAALAGLGYLAYKKGVFKRTPKGMLKKVEGITPNRKHAYKVDDRGLRTGTLYKRKDTYDPNTGKKIIGKTVDAQDGRDIYLRNWKKMGYSKDKIDSLIKAKMSTNDFSDVF